MDLWNPDFCKFFYAPIPEEVLSLAEEVTHPTSAHVSQVHEPTSDIQEVCLENSTLPVNSPALLVPGMHPELTFSIPLCSPHAYNCNALPMLLNKPIPPTIVTNLGILSLSLSYIKLAHVEKLILVHEVILLWYNIITSVM